MKEKGKRNREGSKSDLDVFFVNFHLAL